MTLLQPLARSDFAAVAVLARTIWLEHYIKIITREQIEYMLGGRFSAANLERYLDASDRWMFVLRLDAELVGYLSYALTSAPREMKLEQLYLLPALHGRGLGRLMLEHVEAHSRELGMQSLVLQVNKHNTTASKVYFKAGFEIREEVVIDIGQGYVMDDYIMVKQLQ